MAEISELIESTEGLLKGRFGYVVVHIAGRVGCQNVIKRVRSESAGRDFGAGDEPPNARVVRLDGGWR